MKIKSTGKRIKEWIGRRARLAKKVFSSAGTITKFTLMATGVVSGIVGIIIGSVVGLGKLTVMGVMASKASNRKEKICQQISRTYRDTNRFHKPYRLRDKSLYGIGEQGGGSKSVPHSLKDFMKDNKKIISDKEVKEWYKYSIENLKNIQKINNIQKLIKKIERYEASGNKNELRKAILEALKKELKTIKINKSGKDLQTLVFNMVNNKGENKGKIKEMEWEEFINFYDRMNKPKIWKLFENTHEQLFTKGFIRR